MMKFLDIKTDFAFKKVFGSEHSKELLISFLNAVFVDSTTGLLTELSDARNNVTRYAYNPYGNITHITQVVDGGDDIIEQRHYYNDTDVTKLGRLKTETSALGLITTDTYDVRGNILTRNVSDGGTIHYTTEYEYDASDNLVKTIVPKGNSTVYHYDLLNRKIQQTNTIDGLVHSKSYIYDALGRLSSVINERDQANHTHYNSRSKVSYKVMPSHF